MILARESRSSNKPPRNALDVFVFKIRVTVRKILNRKGEKGMPEEGLRGMRCRCLQINREMTRFFTNEG